MKNLVVFFTVITILAGMGGLCFQISAEYKKR